MAFKLFDTHVHLDDAQLFDSVADVIERAVAAGVENMMAIGTDLASSRRCVALAERYAEVRAAVGVQPNYVHEAGPGDWDEIRALSRHPEVSAIGETGLDHYWDFAPLETQRPFFRRHIELAMELALPLVIHMREPKDCESDPCGQDILQQLQPHRGSVQGIMHSFVGTTDLANRCLDLGLYISFAGMVTYKKSQSLRDVAKQIPSDRLLIETDAPYLSPHPKRGQRPNEPALVVHTAECLANVRGVTLEELAKTTTENAVRLLRKN